MIEIIPAIDIIEGKCVRLTKGNYSEKKIYNENPLEVALMFEDAGLKSLHLVDLDGAKAKHIVNWKTLEKISSKTSLSIDFGGGIKSEGDLKIAFDCGASQITAGSLAVTDELQVMQWLKKYGVEKIIIGADVKNEKISIHGWKEDTEINLFDFLKKYREKNAKYFICTDIEKDGMMQGSSPDLYKKILEKNAGIKLIASGGVSSLADIEMLDKTGCFGAIIGKAIYEGKINLKEISRMIS